MKTFALLLAALLPCLAAGPATDKGTTMGSPTAPIVMELYSDFMCPHCKHLHENILPTRPRAHLILKKDASHAIVEVALRRI